MRLLRRAVPALPAGLTLLRPPRDALLSTASCCFEERPETCAGAFVGDLNRGRPRDAVLGKSRDRPVRDRVLLNDEGT
jgi:hypothetical protein